MECANTHTKELTNDTHYEANNGKLMLQLTSSVILLLFFSWLLYWGVGVLLSPYRPFADAIKITSSSPRGQRIRFFLAKDIEMLDLVFSTDS